MVDRKLRIDRKRTQEAHPFVQAGTADAMHREADHQKFLDWRDRFWPRHDKKPELEKHWLKESV